MKSVKKYSKKKSRVQRKVQRKVQPKVQVRSNKKRVNKKVNRGTKKLKRSKSRKNTKKNLQSGGLKFLPEKLSRILKNRKNERRRKELLRRNIRYGRPNSELVFDAPKELNENGNGNGNEIDVKAIFWMRDGTLSDAHCTEKMLNIT